MSNEVSIYELKDKFDIGIARSRSTGWRVDVQLIDKHDKSQNTGTLYWDEQNGYYFELHNPASNNLQDVIDRPEFEYSLDSIIHGGE